MAYQRIKSLFMVLSHTFTCHKLSPYGYRNN
uniref:Uncharacterized protein n=1 Tax=Arundo donax TaxID=35708 RepID=A0A0A9AB15_ARUDO